MSTERKATDSPGNPSKCAHRVLTLAEKVKVIEASGLNNVKTALKFNCGPTQIANIYLNKTAIMEAYTNGRNSDSKYLEPKPAMYPEIDEGVWQFFCEVRSKSMPVNGGLLKSEYLNSLNSKMKRNGRHILLLLDNCPSHPDIKLSNIRLQFLPKNTTSHLQRLDRGAIAWIKSYYKRLLMFTLRIAIKESQDIVELAKNVKIYPAIINT